jgi:DNA repair protein RadB
MTDPSMTVEVFKPEMAYEVLSGLKRVTLRKVPAKAFNLKVNLYQTMVSAGDILTGELETGAVYLIYGAGGVGKTTLAACAAARVATRDAVVWMDCGGRMYLPRLYQILDSHKADPGRVYISSPSTFQEQTEAVLKIADYMPSKTALVVVDDLTYLHRLALTGDVSEDFHIYELLAFQVALLKEISLDRAISTILVGHVHDIPEKDVSIPVASRIVTFWADAIARVVYEGGVRSLVEEKPGRETIFFKLTSEGVVPMRSSP